MALLLKPSRLKLIIGLISIPKEGHIFSGSYNPTAKLEQQKHDVKMIGDTNAISFQKLSKNICRK